MQQKKKKKIPPRRRRYESIPTAKTNTHANTAADDMIRVVYAIQGHYWLIIIDWSDRLRVAFCRRRRSGTTHAPALARVREREKRSRRYDQENIRRRRRLFGPRTTAKSHRRGSAGIGRLFFFFSIPTHTYYYILYKLFSFFHSHRFEFFFFPRVVNITITIITGGLYCARAY